MARWTCSAAMVLVLISMTRTGAANPAAPFLHIRSDQPQLLELLTDTARVSPTFRHLVDQIDGSDLVVYIRYRNGLGVHVAGQTTFLAGAGGFRYLRVSIDPALSGLHVMALLGHELQHAVEIAGAPSIVDAHSLEAFYRETGFESPAGCGKCFESAKAIAVQRRIQREVLTGGHAVATPMTR